jgi:hypothetical protein
MTDAMSFLFPNYWLGSLKQRIERKTCAGIKPHGIGVASGNGGAKTNGIRNHPVKVAGGTVKVKDEVKLAFSIALLK